ncbi:MAG: prepilin-type N-terminal cleavage/methylation domain-containing protein [Candidatus Omnitrophota bacterium]
MKWPSLNGFTLAELMVVLLIVSIMAAFTIPQFSKTINRSRARSAMTNISIIHAANSLYFSRYGINNSAATVSDINTKLGLNIRADDATYVCSSTDCRATGTGFTVISSAVSSGLPSCTGINCP